MAWAFAIAAMVVGWTYAGWLLALVAVDAWRRLRLAARAPVPAAAKSTRGPPTVSVLIAAHDEASVIEGKLDNTLALDWPRDRLEILVGSDGSTDGTDELVRAYEDKGVVLSTAARAGKAAVLNRLAKRATGDVLLFTDANTIIARDALRHLCAALEVPGTGAVSGRLRLVTPDGGDASEGLYWRYETLLKTYESKVGALVGANGGLYVLRASLWQPLREDTIVDDFVVSMRPLLRGLRVVYEPRAVAVEETAPTPRGEWRRRVRIAAGNFQSLRELHPLLTRPSLSGLAFWSHKIFRWLAPFALLVMLMTSAVMASSSLVWAAVFASQVAFYALAVAGRLGLQGRLPSLARYFTEMNAALVVGLVRCLRGSQAAAWQRTPRRPSRRAA